jgi:hypothetical protein
MIVGKMASGKTTVANYIIENYSNVKRLTLAGPVYDVVNNIDAMDWKEILDEYILPYYDPRDGMARSLGLDIPDEFLNKWKNIIEETKVIPNEKPKPRKRLQFLGTDGARKRIDDEIWIKIAFSKASNEPNTTWVIDDCRFKNEFTKFTNNNWLPIFLHTTKRVQKDRLNALYGEFEESILTHPSEKEMDEICIPTECIINSNQPAELMLQDIKDFLWKKKIFS